MKKLWKLFITMLYLSTFTFGGGFVIVTLMKKRLVDELHWLEEDEMLDLTAMAQSCPGAIAVNASILVGYRVASFPGAAVATLGCILPPLIILTVISFFYDAFRSNPYVGVVLKGMQAGVSAVIFDVVITQAARVLKTRKPSAILTMPIAFLLAYVCKVNVVLVILATGLLGVILVLIEGRKNKG